MKRIAIAVFAVALAATALGNAYARPEGGYREGLTFGIGLGAGQMDCSPDTCQDLTESGSIDLHIGGMLTPGLAGLADIWWMAHDDERVTLDQGIVTGGLRFWPINHFWLQGGLGVARASYDYDAGMVNLVDRSEWVPAFQVGLGVEPIATPDFGLDIALRYGTGFYSDGDRRIHSGALVLGASFY
jgi:hypothetical protein